METYDESTLDRVHMSLRLAGLEPNQVNDAIREMQNHGILFRERSKGPVDFHTKAKILVANYINETTEHTVSLDKLHVTWFSKTLQNWKALVVLIPPTGMYYEVTHDGENEVTYIDAYEKRKNVAVPD